MNFKDNFWVQSTIIVGRTLLKNLPLGIALYFVVIFLFETSDSFNTTAIVGFIWVFLLVQGVFDCADHLKQIAKNLTPNQSKDLNRE